MIVADCSAIVHILAADEIDDNLADLLAKERIHAPDLLDIEILHALRGLLIDRKISPERAAQARLLHERFTIIRYAGKVLAERIWSLRHNLTAYDAAYVALADALGCPLVTRDAKLVGAGHTAEIALLQGCTELVEVVALSIKPAVLPDSTAQKGTGAGVGTVGAGSYHFVHVRS